jgi:heterotetrameric sarcosine oxidase alpha subunit
MTQPFRRAEGGLIDRAKVETFHFDGRALTGHPGDTLASALLANGVRLVGRSFKYHRPRGILSAGPEEPNAIVELREGARREANTRATVAELYDGLVARSQNRWPSLGLDLLSINALVAPILGAGFYYKTFMWPASFWERVYEPLIRRAAGLGRAADEADLDHYEKVTAFCDVLVVGSGPAGLMAALSAGRSGARVILCEEDFRLGGRLMSERLAIDDAPALAWVAQAEAELASLPEVVVMRRTSVFGVYDGGTYGALQRVADHLPVPPPHQPRQRLWRIVAKRCVLAAGAIERPVVFEGNDTPGVMLAGAVRGYLNRYAVVPGRTAVVFANNDDAGRTAADLVAAGVDVAAVVESRSGSLVTRASGGRGLRAVEITHASGRRETVACNLLAMSGGWNPSLHLTTHFGAKPVYDAALCAFLPGQPPPGMTVAGAAVGHFSTAEALADGARLGASAATECGFTSPDALLPKATTETTGIAPLWHSGGTFSGKAFVDFQNDVTAKDIKLAEQEGFRSVEHMKRYTTLGMATDQGKTSNVNALAIMAELTGRSIPDTGTTLIRPPVQPVAIGAFAGHHRGRDFRPTRLPPTHQWAIEQGAVFTEAGQWLRAQWYPRTGETDWQQTVNREVLGVRNAVGICDVTTLGKIDIQGRDAAEFLERVYTNAWKSLAVGRVRYGLMLREDGFVFDDGTTARLDEMHYVMTTTTANAAGVLQHLEYCHQWLWPDLDVQMISVTEQWAQIAVAGPRARDLLRRVVDASVDLSDAAIPYMGAAAVTVLGGLQARLFRISFSGELAYELAVPADHGDALVRKLMAEGADLGVTPYGTEALGVLRIEKGHAAGAELNGQTTAHDLGLGKLVSSKKDFIGRAMAARPVLTDPARPTLVGLRPVDPADSLPAGAHLLPRGAAGVSAHDQGWLTSTAWSATLGTWIGLGLLAHGPSRHGEIMAAHDPLRGRVIAVEIVSPIFVDPKGDRLRG